MITVEQLAESMVKAGFTRIPDPIGKKLKTISYSKSRLFAAPSEPWFYTIGKNMLNYGIGTKWNQVHFETSEYHKIYGRGSKNHIGDILVYHGQFTDPGIKVETFKNGCSLIGPSFASKLFDGKNKDNLIKIVRYIKKLVK